MYPDELIRVSVVEDHLAFREMLCEDLESRGYLVEAFESAEHLLGRPGQSMAQVALIDLNLPGEDGYYLTRVLRQRFPNIGIIMLTARSELKDKLAGYQSGADMYFSKPVEPEELDAAIRALYRRISIPSNPDLSLNLLQTALVHPNGQAVGLSQDEVTLLVALSQASDLKLEYWELADHLGLSLDSETLRVTLEKRVSRLRSKLAQLDQPPSSIRAIRGYGYKLTVNLLLVG